MQDLDGKVAFVTGAARGQGRSHCQLLASHGVRIIATDICAQIDTVGYPLSRAEDLDKTVELIESAGGKIVARQVDVRDQSGLKDAVTEGVEAFGRLDIVLANAGIMAHGIPPDDRSEQAFRDSVDVMLVGVWNTLQATVPTMLDIGNGGSIVITSSAAGLYSPMTDMRGGYDGYVASKAGVIGLMRAYAGQLAQHSIRVNSVHPTGVATPMCLNDFFPKYVAANEYMVEKLQNPMPVEMIEARDVSNAILYLVSDSGRYVTGITLPVDAGISS